MNPIKIGLDVHGVIDKYPEIFSKLSKEWVEKGYEVHIITGQEWQTAVIQVVAAKITYTHHYSIVDHNRKLGRHLYTRDDKQGIWMDDDIWNRSKGAYAYSVHLDVHYDDSLTYVEHFPFYCTYVVVSNRFETFYENMIL